LRLLGLVLIVVILLNRNIDVLRWVVILLLGEVVLRVLDSSSNNIITILRRARVVDIVNWD